MLLIQSTYVMEDVNKSNSTKVVDVSDKQEMRYGTCLFCTCTYCSYV